MLSSIFDAPAQLDIPIYRGDSFVLQWQLLTTNGRATSYPTDVLTAPVTLAGVTFTPVNLTGSTVSAQIRRTTAFAESLLTAFTVNVLDASNGLVELTLTPTQTATLGSSDGKTFRYDLQVTNPAGRVKTYLYGSVVETLDVTRA